MSDEVKSTRLHIGNVSANLAEKKSTLSDRLSKFGTITSDLTFHSKPLQDFYFAYITMDLSDSQFEKLKAAFNGIQFMGRKLTIAKAKPDWKTAWEKDHNRIDTTKAERIARDKVANARAQRIKEASTLHKLNSVTDHVIIPSTLAANDAGYGYHISNHTYNNMSANTKNKPPSQTLDGLRSYGSLTHPLQKNSCLQQYSNTSGGSELIKGRLRKTPRPSDHFVKRQQTMRILINGELKLLKSYKTKLWGYEKNKSLNDLTYKFVNGVWRSGDNHIVDSNTNAKKLSGDHCGISASGATSYGHDTAVGANDESMDDENLLLAQENQKNKAVLASLFSKFDFEKPMEVEEDTLGIDKEDITFDSKGRRRVTRYDYEIQGGLQSDEEDFDIANVDGADDIIESYKSTVEQPAPEVYYDEDDEGNEIDLDALGQQYTTEAIKDKYDEDHGFEVVSSKEASTYEAKENKFSARDVKEEQQVHHQSQHKEHVSDEDIDDEFMPTFGSSGKAVPLNDTETLRTLFNPNDNEGGFKLALSEDDEDVDEEKVVDLKQQQELLQQIKKQQEEEFIKQQASKFGLFWNHFDSHFLQTQTQLSKLGSSNDNVKLPGEQQEVSTITDRDPSGETDYEKWFWSMRGEISRECKRRKRDVSRIFKKKSRKSTFV